MDFVNARQPVAAIALSGGVDSAAAAYLCMRRGYACLGVTMRLPGGSIAGAEAVARRLGLPLHVYDARADFAREVVTPFAQGYIGGATPNPCVACNRAVKFGGLLRFALGLGADCLATGHYARIGSAAGRLRIKKALDAHKDQSYYLYALDQAQLRRVLFPLGALTKPEVREIARAQGFIDAETPESQDICFVPGGDYAAFIQAHSAYDPAPGFFTDAAGNCLGRHRGHIHYTIGQRKGLGVAGPFPFYVLDKDAAANTVVLGSDADLFSRRLTAARCVWGGPVPAPFRARARLRSRQAEQWAAVSPDGADGAEIVFDEPQRAISPGQHVVIYDGDTVVGGGVIQRAYFTMGK